MRELRLVAVSEDGSHLILAGHGGEQLALRVDERLHAAIQGDRARLGQLDIQLESQLRPRDIQARIRAGESVDAVAAVAGMPREKVERFAGPVIAEREHVAGRARQATVRRLGGDGPPQTLEAAATATAVSHGADPQQVEWDAWRRDDGRWLVRFTWAADEEESALFSFDPAGRTVVPEDTVARAIAGVLPAQSPMPVGPARLSVVETSDSDDMVDDDFARSPVSSFVTPAPVRDLTDLDDASGDEPVDDHEPTRPLPAVSRRGRRGQRTTRDRRRREPELWHERDDQHPTEDAEPTSERLRLRDIATNVETEAEADLAPTADEPTRKPSASSNRSRRPSVPSWDEIMFGRRKNDG
jgi:hypothetical protein